MEITNEQIIKEIKKNRKMIRELNNNVCMWLLVIGLLLTIALFISPVSAWSKCNPYEGNIVYLSNPYTVPVCSQASTGTYYVWFTNSSNSTYDGDIYTGTHRAESATLNCYQTPLGNTSYAVITRSAGGCDYKHETYIMNNFYFLTAAFTAVPQSGNQSLIVSFTPSIYGTSINRAVWDFDGGLGTETKYSGFNTPFNKTYNVAGRYIARLSVYDNGTNISTASKNINVYNYTLGITPTPTLTPTPTATPQGTNTSSSMKIDGYDTGNYTNIAGLSIGMIDTDDVGSGWFNVTAATGTYNFIGYGAGGNKPFVINHHYMWQLSKTGYQTFTSPAYEYLGNYEYNRYPMVLSINVPTASTFTLKINLRNVDTGDITSALSGTVKLSNQSSVWTSTQTNPTSGIEIFSGLTPSASYNIDINVNGYESYQGVFASSSSMAGTTQLFNAELIPSSDLPSSFTLSVNPATGTANDTYSFTLTGDISGANRIQYKYGNSGEENTAFTSSATGTTVYSKISGSWKGWDGSAYTVSTSNPLSVSGKMASLIPTEDDISVAVDITINGNVYTARDTIKMVSTGKSPKIIQGCDMSASGGGDRCAIIYIYNYHIYDVYSGIWTNGTVDDAETRYYYHTPNALTTYYGSAVGYYDTVAETKILRDGSGGIELHFYKSNAPITPTNVTVHAQVQNLNGTAINGAKVVFNDGQICYTKNGGDCSVLTLTGITFGGTASAYSFMSAVSSITTSNTSSNVLKFTLLKATSTPSVYPSVTGGIKTTPTFTNTSGINQTPREEYVCQVDTSNMLPFDIFMNMVACAGVKGVTAQGFMISAILMFFFAYSLSKYGGGMGVMGGIIIGGIVSIGLGTLPFWIVIVIIIVCGLIFASLMSKQGAG